jgi:hypothetical protein
MTEETKIKDTGINHIEQYQRIKDEKLQMVTMSSDIATGDCQFIGTFELTGERNGQAFRSSPVNFPINAATIQEAFEVYDEQAEPHIERAQSQLDAMLNGQRRSPGGIIMPGEELSDAEIARRIQKDVIGNG